MYLLGTATNLHQFTLPEKIVWLGPWLSWSLCLRLTTINCRVTLALAKKQL